MTTGLLLGQDVAVAAWTWKAFGLTPLYVNSAVGLLVDEELVGSAIFHNYNGTNVEFSYYSKHTLTAGIVKFLARVALFELQVERVTFHVRKNDKRLIRHLLRFGAKHEATMWQFYGRERASKNAALQYVMFREQLLPLAGAAYARSKMH